MTLNDPSGAGHLTPQQWLLASVEMGVRYPIPTDEYSRWFTDGGPVKLVSQGCKIGAILAVRILG